MKKEPIKSLTALPNIGKTLAAELVDCGYENAESLQNHNTIEICLMLRGKGYNMCYNKLYAIEGAKRNIRWDGLSTDDKKMLKQKYDSAIGSIE